VRVFFNLGLVHTLEYVVASADLKPSTEHSPRGAELHWNADTFAEMHHFIAVAACEE
jgi:hypothetical protein